MVIRRGRKCVGGIFQLEHLVHSHQRFEQAFFWDRKSSKHSAKISTLKIVYRRVVRDRTQEMILTKFV